MPFDASEYAEKFLLSNGVKIFLNERIVNGERTYKTDKREIKADLAFLCTGIKPNTSFHGDFKREGDLIIVNEFLQAEKTKNIFVAGDIISVREEKTAQNAKAHAKIIAENILALESKKKLKEYVPKKRIMIINIFIAI